MPIKHHLTAWFAAALLLVAPLALAAPVANADAPAPPPPTCYDGVMVVVTKDDGSTTGKCVMDANTGTDALTRTGVTITRDSSGMICALNNYPDPCPAASDTNRWQYYEASSLYDARSGNWALAATGSDDTHPQPGTIEGWCYGAQCRPVLPAGLASPLNGSTTDEWRAGVIIVIAVAVVVIAVVVVIEMVRRRPAIHRWPDP